MNALDIKLNEAFPGKVVRKDLLHEIKRAVNVPSFVLEFLLSRYCASEDPEEIEEGKKAVLQTIEKCYVRPDESNKAQAIVEQKKRHKSMLSTLNAKRDTGLRWKTLPLSA